MFCTELSNKVNVFSLRDDYRGNTESRDGGQEPKKELE